MSSVVQVFHEGKSDVIVANLDIAMDYVSRVLAPKAEDLARMRSRDEFPSLDDADLCGSYYHRLRMEAEKQRKVFSFVEHELKAGVVGSTAGRRFDLTTDFDPSYQVQEGLWRMASDESLSMAEEAKFLHGIVSLNISVLRKNKTDQEILEHLKRTHETMKGTDLLSGIDGSAKDVLDALPEAARQKFVALASIAFPQRNQPPTRAIAP